MKQLQIVGSAIAIILCSGTLVSAQTIADVARRERARRQGATAKIVVNNEHLRQNLKSEAAITETPPKDVDEDLKPEVTAAPADGRDEKWWRGQFDKVRTEIKRLEAEIPVLESQLQTANREFLTRAYDPDGRGQKAISDINIKLDGTRKELAAAKASVTQLETDMRRADAPAGWAR